MKSSTIRFIASALMAVSLWGGAAQAQTLVVATDTAFVPFEFKQGDKYVGFDIDLWDAVAKAKRERDAGADADDRKRKYNSLTTTECTAEDMEAYRRTKIDKADPMAAFLEDP